MAFLPPDIAYQVTVATYVLVGSLGVSSHVAILFLVRGIYMVRFSPGDDLGYLEQSQE